MKTNYSTLKKSALVGLVALTSYLPMKAKAGDKVKADDYSNKDINQITQAYFDSHSFDIAMENPQTEKSGWKVEAVRNGETGASEVKVMYTANNWREFLWGVSRPVHLWNHNPQTGKLEILPAYIGRDGLGAFKAGGILSPLEGLVAFPINGVQKLCGQSGDKLFYNAFLDDWSLTLGTTADYALLGLAAGCSGGGSSQPAEEDSQPKNKPKDNPKDDTSDEPSDPGNDGGDGGVL